MKTLRILLVGIVALAAGLVGSTHAQTLWYTLDTPNPQEDAYFGQPLAMGDVNGDGYADVAVGVLYEDVGGNADQGRAYVYSGANGSLLFTLDTPNPQDGANFGRSVAVGDVNGDGKADIAVGADDEDVGGNADQGRAYVFSGVDGSLLFTLDTPNPQAGAHFGGSVAVGHVTDDDRADIAVGTLGEDVGGNENQGRAYVFSGADGSLLLTLDSPNPQVSALFGCSVAVGDVNADSKADIAVGTPGEDVGGNDSQGRAYVFSGVNGSLLFTLDIPEPCSGVQFGRSLAVGDVSGDGKADVVLGAYLWIDGGAFGYGQGQAYVSSQADGSLISGRAYVSSGANGSLLYVLDSPYPQKNGSFGESVAVGDVNGDGKADIAVGAPYEDVGDNYGQGRAYVFSGADASLHFMPGLDTPNPQAWSHFGDSLAVGDVDGDGWGDVAVGAPGEGVGDNTNQGRAYVFLMHCYDGVDSDLDGFEDDLECYVGTDLLDACPDDPSDDAWPLDVNVDTYLTVVGDVLNYAGNIGASVGGDPLLQRLDLDANGSITVVGDVLLYRNMIGEGCTNP